jgi:hypothetical protein
MKKSLPLFFLPVFLFACVSVAKRRPAQYSVAEMYPQAKFRHPKLDFQTFLGRIKASRASTVAEALEALHKTHSAYMTVHTLVYDSLSLQEASFLEPRAVVFGPEADFIFTFNGGTHQRGGYGIETMQFNPVTAEFEFREIEFKKELAPDEQEELLHEDVDFEDARIKVSKKNPTRCTQCHGTPPQPNWDTYYFWPGVYGSNDDLLTSLFDRSEVASNPNYEGFGLDKIFGHSQGRTLKLAEGAVDREVEGFKKHIAARSQHPRFRWLPLRAIDQAYVRWNAGEEKEKIDTSPAIKAEFAYLGISYPAHRPNLHLTDLLYARTAPKAAKAIKAISPRMPLQMAYFWKPYAITSRTDWDSSSRISP